MRPISIAIFFCLLSCGSRAQQANHYFIAFLDKNPTAGERSREESAKLLKAHLETLQALQRAGKVVAVGRFEDGGAMLIFNCPTTDDVTSALDADPSILANQWKVEVRPLRSHFGKYCPASETGEPAKYFFARFDAVVSKFTASTYPEILARHDAYVRKIVDTGNVVVGGDFGSEEGGIVLMKGMVQPEIFEADPGVQEGLIELTIRDVHVARGTFCEK